MKKLIQISTRDGIAPAGLFTPVDGRPVRAGVLFFMDAMGPRPSMDEMAQRLADDGYLVLLPDLFYRFGEYGPYTGSAFAHETSRNQLLKMMGETTVEMTTSDTEAFLQVFEREGVAPPLGVVGYCMSGRRALTVAAKFPDRFAAAASFHGAALASDTADSPHLLASEIKARVYVGTASDDGSFPPEQSTRFADAFRRAGADFALESYVGMQHGWTVPDRDGVYDEAGAERHWRRLLQLFGETLGRS
ncbi:dienelactone hydrolase family protein [Rhizobium sp. XQZ8]|uniref:dienelactone hydrolase family protein n=1 Tax=Rhizobium populisoli TaxID=2859785 RepID=UPI001C6625BA|nr:dienelactone hydrolase family protein [Rhizobium populisoli]MBW6425575.1 dienelactone hydrolase family protein [Rhizobium populisoli]